VAPVVEAVVVQARQPVGATRIGHTQAVNASLMRASFSFAASVASLFSTRFSTPSSMMVSKIRGVARFSASCGS